MRAATKSLFHIRLTLGKIQLLAPTVLLLSGALLCGSGVAQRPAYGPPEGYPAWVAVPPVDPATLPPSKFVDSAAAIKQALREAVPGDVIVVKSGVYTGDYFRIMGGVSGTPERPITLMAEHPGQVTFVRGDGWAVVRVFDGCSYWRIIGIRIVGGVPRPEHGLLMKQCSHITFQDCEISGTKHAVKVESAPTYPANHLIFSGLRISGNNVGLQVGIKDYSWTEHVIVEDCRSESTTDSGCDGFTIENKLSSDILIRDCLATNNADAGFDVKPNARIVRCISHHNGKSGFKIWRGCEVVNCLSYANGYYAFQLVGNSEDVPYSKSLVNCTAVGANALLIGAFGGLYMRNCIIVGNISNGVAQPDVDYCLFARDPGGWKGAHSIVGDPMFADASGGNYQLLQGSPAIDAGTFWLGASPDLRMIPRQQPYDLGCYEFSTVRQNQPPTAPEVDIIPDRPTTNDDLSCVITVGSQDPDGDQVAYRYQWYKNGELQPGQTRSRVSRELTRKGEIWKCVVVPTDGTSDGSPGEASETIANSPPHLRWADIGGSEVGHARPGPFTFRVVVEDPDGTQPQMMRVRVERLEDGRRWRGVACAELELASGNWQAGALCQASPTLPNGVLRSRIEVRDDEGAWGTGSPAEWTAGPVMDAPPQLWVTYRRDLRREFVTPTTGVHNDTLFLFGVLYTDAEGDYPIERRLEIERKSGDGRWVPYKSHSMHEGSGDPVSGLTYILRRRLPKGQYRFRFVFSDVDGKATGADSSVVDAARWRGGLSVQDNTTRIASASGITVTSLVATPTQQGAQVCFALSCGGNVSLRVLNIAGREVRCFTSIQASPGPNTFLWDGRSNTGASAPAGAYLVELTALSPRGDRVKAVAPLHLVR